MPLFDDLAQAQPVGPRLPPTVQNPGYAYLMGGAMGSAAGNAAGQAGGGNQPGQPTTGAPAGPTQGAGSNATIQQLQQIVSQFDPAFLRSVLPQLQALGIEVQNQERGDLRPRFRLPNGDVWDFGPGGWVSRGQMGPGFSEGGAAGGSGLTKDAGMGGDQFAQFRNSPGYQFDVDQMMEAVQRSAAARGTLLTGGTMRRLQENAGGLADRYVQDRIRALTALTSAGR